MEKDTKRKAHMTLLYSTIISSLSSFTFGMILTSFEGIHDVVTKSTLQNRIFGESTKITEEQWGTLNSIIAIGALISNLGISKLSLSSKNILLINNLFYFLGLFFIFVMYNFYVMLVGKIIIGFAIGISCSVLPYYLSSISPVSIRGIICSFHSLGIVFGVVAGQILSYFFHEKHCWWFSYYIIFIYLICHSLLLFFIRDTKIEEKKGITVCELIKINEARKSLIMAILLHLGQQTSCINGILYYSNKILEKEKNPRMSTIYVGVSSVLSTLLSMVLIERFGRKFMLLLSCFITFISLAMLTVKYQMLVALFIFMTGFNLGLGPVVWFITSEIFPVGYLSAGCTVAVSLNWISNFIIAELFPILMKYFKNYCFAFFGGSLIILFFYVMIFFRETKGKSVNFQ